MNEPSTDLSARNLPPWLTEAADVLWARRRLVIAAALVTVLIGVIGSLVAPSLLPPRAIVGAAVGIAAVLLAAAIGLAVDAADLVVRGARHVRAAGADVAASVGSDVRDVGPLLARVAVHAQDGRIRVALVPASRDAGAPGARASALAEALARTGKRVLVTDLTRPASPTPGLSEVVTGERRLADVARLEEDLYLARVPVGTDPPAALHGLAEWVDHLPSDLEVLVIALPPLAEPGVMPAAGVADFLLIQVEADRTERVDLIAALDAVDAAGLTADVILVDPSRSWTEKADAAAVDTPAVPAADEAEDEHEADDLDIALADQADAGDVVEQSAPVDASDEAFAEPPAETPAEPDADVEGESGRAIVDDLDVGAPIEDVTSTSEMAVPRAHHPRDLAHVWDDNTDDVGGGAQPAAVPEAESDLQPEPELEPEPEAELEPEPEAELEPEPEPEPAPVAEAVSAPEPAPEPAPAEPAQPTAVPPPPTGDVDDLAREAVRTAAALYALAEEVWRREEGE